MENVSEALLKELIESVLEGRNILHKKSAEINPVSLEKKENHLMYKIWKCRQMVKIGRK